MATKKTRKQQELEIEAINIVDEERTKWEDATCYVTEKVAFRMRELIRILRKNYWGIFDEPKDRITGRDKVWIGLIMSTVETWVKNSDLDSKDFGFLARTPDGTSITEIVRLGVKEKLNRLLFGEKLDESTRQGLIDGTFVWKTWETKDGGKTKLNFKQVDLLNIYIDPTEENIQSAFRFTERSVATPSAIRSMTGWKNTDLTDTDGAYGVAKTDGSRLNNTQTTTGAFVDVWETWGKIPKYLVTGDKKAEDAHMLIDGHIVVSGLEAGEKRCHLIEENKKKDYCGNIIKPYEEFRCAKIAGRWYGLGPAERILALQEMLNTNANVRQNRSIMAQSGLWKIRKGSGITPQSLARLPVNGAIQVTQADDLQQVAIADVPLSSYKDEDVIKYWAQQISSAQPISSGEILPSSSTATSASISNTNAKSAYIMFQEALGMFLGRWSDRHAMPILAKDFKIGDIYRLTADDEKFEEIAERLAKYSVAEAMEKGSVVPSFAEMEQAIESEKQRIISSGTVFSELMEEVIASSVETQVKFTNEDLDTAVAVNNIIQMSNIPVTPQNINQIKLAYDLMGLPAPKIPMPEPMGQEGVGNGIASEGAQATDINARNMTGGIAMGAQNVV